MSIRTQARKLSKPNQWARSHQLSMSTRTQASKLSMPNHMDMISSTGSYKQGTNYSLAVINVEFIPTNVFEVYMLQDKVNRPNQNSYIVIYITRIRQSFYVLQHSGNRRN